MRQPGFSFSMKYLPVVFSGGLIALLVWKLMALELRYLIAIVGGLLFLSFVMIGIFFISDILIYAFVFNIPFSMFGKVFFKQDVAWAVMPGISIGLAEALILLSYFMWFCQIFVARKEPLPRLQKIDYFIFLLIFSQAVSLLGAPNKILGFFDIIHNVKHALIYFFIAHKIQRHHIKWIITIILFAIILESSIAYYERVTGNVGIGRAKGRVGSSQESPLGTQHIVPGIEHMIRAEGTTAEPHILGEYYAMILPIPFVLMLIPYLKKKIRFILFIILVIGMGGLIVSFSRSGWLSFAIASVFAIGVMVFSWRLYSAAVLAFVVFLTVSLVYPQGYHYVYTRIFEAPMELLSERFEMNKTALGIWRKNFFFGYGAANYLEALDDPDIRVYEGVDRTYRALPVHNMFLYLASEIGLFGAIGFFGIVFSVMARCWKSLKCRDPLIRGLALAILTGLVAYLLDGLTNCLFRQAVNYAQLWVYFGIGISFRRLLEEPKSGKRTFATSAFSPA